MFGLWCSQKQLSDSALSVCATASSSSFRTHHSCCTGPVSSACLEGAGEVLLLLGLAWPQQQVGLGPHTPRPSSKVLGFLQAVSDGFDRVHPTSGACGEPSQQQQDEDEASSSSRVLLSSPLLAVASLDPVLSLLLPGAWAVVVEGAWWEHGAVAAGP